MDLAETGQLIRGGNNDGTGFVDRFFGQKGLCPYHVRQIKVGCIGQAEEGV